MGAAKKAENADNAPAAPRAPRERITGHQQPLPADTEQLTLPVNNKMAKKRSSAKSSIMEMNLKTIRQKKNWMSAAIPERGIGHLVMQAGRTFGNAMQQRLASHGVTLSQWLHLRALFDNSGMTQSALSKHLGVEKASSTAILNHLESHKLIRRVTNEKDRRRTNLELTQEGVTFVRKVLPNAIELNSIARKGLTPREVRTFVYVMRTMIENLQNFEGPM